MTIYHIHATIVKWRQSKKKSTEKSLSAHKFEALIFLQYIDIDKIKHLLFLKISIIRRGFFSFSVWV